MITLKCDPQAHSERVYKDAQRLASRAFQNRTGHGGAPFVVYRQMNRQQLVEFALKAYLAGWKASRAICQAEIHWHEHERS